MTPISAAVVRRPVPEDYVRSFVALGAAGIIDEQLASDLAPAADLRNRIVHEYDELDDEIVFRAAQAAPDRFSAYVVAIERCLERQGL